MNKIIVIEGTDCSGKETQSKMLLDRLNNEGLNSLYMTFPAYDTPTGKIVGGSYLGKESIGPCLFPEGAVNVDAKVASLYYAADRLYNKPVIEEKLNDYNLIIDRYVESNMAHQGSKIMDKEKRLEMYNFLSRLEYDLLKLPRPDITIFLYMPYEQACILKKNRTELDQHELNPDHLKHAEECYLELSKLHNYIKIDCVKDGVIRSKEDISEEVYQKVKSKIMN